MLVVQALGLLAPLIVKTILDDYLIGIQRPWYEVLAENDKTVSYQGRFFTQETENTNGISIVIIQGKYYFIDEIAPSGYKELVGNQLTVTTQDNQVLTYQVVPLSRAEVLNFYNPYIQPLTILIIL